MSISQGVTPNPTGLSASGFHANPVSSDQKRQVAVSFQVTSFPEEATSSPTCLSMGE